jgi:hypothetical protein
LRARGWDCAKAKAMYVDASISKPAGDEQVYFQWSLLTIFLRFVDCEKWRKETKLDELVPVWDYPEKPDINKYYKQFYHKTDKVCAVLFWLRLSRAFSNHN